MPSSTEERISQAVVREFTDLYRRFRDVVAAIDVADLNQPPLPGENSIAILAKHALGSERFLLYRAIDRTITRAREDEFVGRSTKDEIIASLDEADRVVAESTALGLTRERPDGAGRSPAELVLRAITHTAEHLAQAELTRTWLASQRS